MAVTVMINPGAAGLTLCRRGSDGVSTANVPDVCNTASVPTPVPYPNSSIAFSSDLANGRTAVGTQDGAEARQLNHEEYNC